MATVDQLNHVSEGEQTSASQQNLIRELLGRSVTGPNVLQLSTGWHIRAPGENEPVWTYIKSVDLNRGLITALQAYLIPFTEGVYRIQGAPIVGLPQPGKMAADYIPFVIFGDQPTAENRSILFAGDHFAFPGGDGVAVSYIPGKVIAVNRIRQEAILAPPNPGIDVADDEMWHDDNNFNFDSAVCCWTMGFSVVDVGWSGIVFQTAWGNWLVYTVNFIAEKDYSRFCPPLGVLGPEIEHTCPPQLDEKICADKCAVNPVTEEMIPVRFPFAVPDGFLLLECECERVRLGRRNPRTGRIPPPRCIEEALPGDLVNRR